MQRKQSTEHPNALNAIARKLTTIEKDDLIKIFKKSPHMLSNIAGAACKEHPNALNAIAEQLKQVTSEDLIEIVEKSPYTLSNIARAAVKGSPHLFQTFLQLFIKEHGLFKLHMNSIQRFQAPESCLPVERIIFNNLKECESFDLCSDKSIIRLNAVSSMVIPYLLEHGLVPPSWVDVYKRNVDKQTYLRMKKIETLINEVNGETFMTQTEELDRQDVTKAVGNTYIQMCLNKVIKYLFEAEVMDDIKKQYHLTHEFSFRKDLMDALGLLIKFRVSDMNDANKLISDIADNLNNLNLRALKAYVTKRIEALPDHGSGAKSGE